jgi:hypothetical protein
LIINDCIYIKNHAKAMQRDAKTRSRDAVFHWENKGGDLVSIQEDNKPVEFVNYEQLPDTPSPERHKAEFVGWVNQAPTPYNDYDIEITPGRLSHVMEGALSVADAFGSAIVITAKGVAALLNGFGRLVFWIGTALVWLFPVRFRWPEDSTPSSGGTCYDYEETTYYHHVKYKKR